MFKEAKIALVRAGCALAVSIPGEAPGTLYVLDERDRAERGSGNGEDGEHGDVLSGGCLATE